MLRALINGNIMFEDEVMSLFCHTSREIWLNFIARRCMDCSDVMTVVINRCRSHVVTLHRQQCSLTFQNERVGTDTFILDVTTQKDIQRNKVMYWWSPMVRITWRNAPLHPLTSWRYVLLQLLTSCYRVLLSTWRRSVKQRCSCWRNDTSHYWPLEVVTSWR